MISGLEVLLYFIIFGIFKHDISAELVALKMQLCKNNLVILLSPTKFTLKTTTNSENMGIHKTFIITALFF